ncbi:hypothetical protein MP228_005109 [Amoeboaphelidium protococcarum]|nr:hypothetical protein MP228_005109 [Amoeboaphelidium protococcarum]
MIISSQKYLKGASLKRIGASRVLSNRWYAHKVIKVPQMADSITEGELARWEKKVGEYVKQDELMATIETDKVDVQFNSPESGVVVEQFFKEGDSVQTGQDFYKLDLDGKPSESSSSTQSQDKSESKQQQQEQSPSATSTSSTQSEQKSEQSKPVAPKEKASSSSGEERVYSSKASTSQSAPAPSKPQAQVDAQPLVFKEGLVPGTYPLPDAFRGERRVKMNRMRQRIAERLKQSQNTAASLTTFNEVDMSSLMAFRSTYKDEVFKQHGVKLGFMSAFVKASVAALQAVPAVNGSIVYPSNDNEDPTIVYHDFVDISVAVATPKGLVTPVIRNCEKLSFIDVEKAIAEFSNKARDNKISIEDMAGGTFTISNGGVFGSMFGTPIINLPQSAILGMHAIKDRAVVVNGKIEVRPMMYLALTYNHSLIDGREGVTFLKTIKEIIEDPRKLLL